MTTGQMCSAILKAMTDIGRDTDDMAKYLKRAPDSEVERLYAHWCLPLRVG
jgi:hypothetical protein